MSEQVQQYSLIDYILFPLMKGTYHALKMTKNVQKSVVDNSKLLFFLTLGQIQSIWHLLQHKTLLHERDVIGQDGDSIYWAYAAVRMLQKVGLGNSMAQITIPKEIRVGQKFKVDYIYHGKPYSVIIFAEDLPELISRFNHVVDNLSEPQAPPASKILKLKVCANKQELDHVTKEHILDLVQKYRSPSNTFYQEIQEEWLSTKIWDIMAFHEIFPHEPVVMTEEHDHSIHVTYIPPLPHNQREYTAEELAQMEIHQLLTKH